MYVSSAFVMSGFTGTFQITILMILSIYMLFVFRRSLSLDKNTIFILLISGIFILLSVLFKGETLKQATVTIALLSVAYIFVNLISYKRFIDAYVNIIIFLCIYSLLTYIVASLWPMLILNFPVVINSADAKAYNLVFSVIRTDFLYLHRNYGLFWEPGAFQFYINMAMIIYLFAQKKKNVLIILVFIVTIVTTFSTVGNIVMLASLIAYMLRKEKTKNNKIKLLVLFFTLSILIIYPNLPANIQYKLFGKIFEYVGNPTVNIISSTGIRMAQ
jgi:hypothetical protein